MVGTTGIEPVTPSMSRKCSPAELRTHSRFGKQHISENRSAVEPILTDLPVANPLAR